MAISKMKPHPVDISLIVPVYNDAQRVKELLAATSAFSLREVIVVDGGSLDDTAAVVEKTPDITLITSLKGRGSQIDAGIRRACGKYIWVVHVDSHLPEGSVEEIKATLECGEICLGCFPVTFQARHFLLRFFAWVSCFDSPFTTFGDQGFFFRRQDYLDQEGVAAWPLLEDVALRQKLLARNKGRVYKSSIMMTSSMRRFKRFGVVKTQLKNAWILARYFCGTSPHILYEEYYGHPSS